MILFWFEIFSWDIRYSKRYLSARILLRTRMQMLKHNSVVKFGVLNSVFLKVKKRLIYKLENLCDIQYGIIPIQVTSMELLERLR
jgi:hypothetical protein